MFSATMRPSIERIARHYLREPVYVHVGGASGAVVEEGRLVEIGRPSLCAMR